MLKVGQIERVEITGYSSEGMGVCRIEGCAVFVPNAIRGEICDVKVTHVSRNSAHGKIEQIHVRSPHRVPRACPDAKLCGGCQLHHMDYEEEPDRVIVVGAMLRHNFLSCFAEGNGVVVHV